MLATCRELFWDTLKLLLSFKKYLLCTRRLVLLLLTANWSLKVYRLNPFALANPAKQLSNCQTRTQAYYSVSLEEVPTTVKRSDRRECSCTSTAPVQGLKLKLPTKDSFQQGTVNGGCGIRVRADLNICDNLLSKSKSQPFHAVQNSSTFLPPKTCKTSLVLFSTSLLRVFTMLTLFPRNTHIKEKCVHTYIYMYHSHIHTQSITCIPVCKMMQSVFSPPQTNL